MIRAPVDGKTAAVEVLRVSGDGVERRGPEALDELLDGPGVVWVDVPAWDDEAAAVLTERFSIHERAAADSARRNPVPKLHVYPGHVFVVLHALGVTCTTSSSTCSSVRTG